MREYYGYIRVSTVKQGERGSSLHEQRDAIEQYARRQGLVISEWFEEKETAAKRGRTVFNKMLASLEKGRASGVIIHKIDRSARNLRDWSDLGELIDRGIEVHFAHESLDLQSRGGRLAADIQAVVASDYIRNLRDEVRKGFYGRLKQGYYPLPAPIGYVDNGAAKPKTLDPRTAPLVRKAFEFYASDEYTFKTLMPELARLGLRNRKGGKVSLNGISTMLNNPFYIGLIRIEKTGEYFQGIHETLIEKSLFDRVQRLLKGKRKIVGLKYSYTYQKMLRCVTCGYSLIAENQKGYVYYRCHTRTCPTTSLREELLERSIFNAFQAFQFTPKEIDLFAVEFKKFEHEYTQQKGALTQSLRLNIDQVAKRLEALTDAFIDRMIDKEAYETRKAKLFMEKAELLEKLAEMESGKDITASRVQNFLELLKRLAHMDELEISTEKRDLVKSVTSNLQVSQKNLVVSWAFPFDALEKCDAVTCGGPQRDRYRMMQILMNRLMET
jgi:DNA invertase Pin-like site-specific DNA recombinase